MLICMHTSDVSMTASVLMLWLPRPAWTYWVYMSMFIYGVCLNTYEKMFTQVSYNLAICGKVLAAAVWRPDKRHQSVLGDGSHYKLWDSYQNQQDLELEALTRTERHLQTSASPYHICTCEVLLHFKQKPNTNLFLWSPVFSFKHKEARFCLKSTTCFFASWVFCANKCYFF